jgi:alpha-glucosidase
VDDAPSGGAAHQEWWRSAVVYHVYLRSFRDSDGDGVGDLAGLIERLDYLNDGTERSLGVDAVWVSPVTHAASRDFGYDVVDYYAVDPRVGDLATFDRLVEECHARGMRVVLDMVLNHTSDQHPWFVESRRSRTSAKRDWYIWRDPGPDGGPPNNWLAIFGGSMWTLDEETGQYYLHSYFVEQPDLNWRNPEVVAAMQDALRFWLRRGADGVRLDAAGRLVKHPQFADSPPNPAYARGEDGEPLLSANTYLHPDLIEPARAIRRVLDEFPNRVSIGEVYAPPDEFAMLYGGHALDGLHLVFNFQLIRRRPRTAYVQWDADVLAAVVRETERALPAGARCCYAVSNHDVPRFATRHNYDGLGQLRARALPLVLLGLPGSPCVYYGDELGLTDIEASDATPRDVLGRDPQRAPMPWDGSLGRGFTSGEPWLPFGPHEPNVAAQDRDPQSLLALYRQAIRIRRQQPSLMRGDVSVEAADQVCTMRREASGAPSVMIVVNTAAEQRRVQIPAAIPRLLLATNDGVEIASGTLVLPPLGAAWLTTN